MPRPNSSSRKNWNGRESRWNANWPSAWARLAPTPIASVRPTCARAKADAESTRAAAMQEARLAAESATTRALEGEFARVRTETEAKLQTELATLREQADTARRLQAQAQQQAEAAREQAARDVQVAAQRAAAKAFEVEAGRIRSEAETRLKLESERSRFENNQRLEDGGGEAAGRGAGARRAAAGGDACATLRGCGAAAVRRTASPTRCVRGTVRSSRADGRCRRFVELAHLGRRGRSRGGCRHHRHRRVLAVWAIGRRTGTSSRSARRGHSTGKRTRRRSARIHAAQPAACPDRARPSASGQTGRERRTPLLRPSRPMASWPCSHGCRWTCVDGVRRGLDRRRPADGGPGPAPNRAGEHCG